MVASRQNVSKVDGITLTATDGIGAHGQKGLRT